MVARNLSAFNLSPHTFRCRPPNKFTVTSRSAHYCKITEISTRLLYRLEIMSVHPSDQPEAIRAVIGQEGQELRGPRTRLYSGATWVRHVTTFEIGRGPCLTIARASCWLSSYKTKLGRFASPCYLHVTRVKRRLEQGQSLQSRNSNGQRVMLGGLTRTS